MSLCPHQLVRSHLSGLWSAQCRHPGRWYRGLGPRNTGYGNQHASSYTSPIEAPGMEGDNIATSTPSHPDTNRESSENTVSKNRREHTGRIRKTRPKQEINEGEGQIEEDAILADLPPRQNSRGFRRGSRRPSTSLLSHEQVRKIMESQGHHIKFVPSTLRRLNGEIQSQKRFIKDKSLYLATIIRGNSIYAHEVELRKWKRAYGEIYKANHYGRAVRNKAALLAPMEQGRAMIKMVQTDCYGGFRKAWQAMSRSDKAMLWQRIAIWLLQNDLKLVLDFLLVTTESQEKPNFTMIVDCLQYLDNFYYWDWLKDWQSGDHTYQSLVESCLHPKDWPILSLPQRGVRLYIRRASHDAVSMALRMVKERNSQMTGETALCFMWRFTEFGDVDRALEALEYIPKLKEPEFTMDSQGVLRHCCKLLTLDSVQDGAEGRNFRILPRLLGMGVRPDRDMMNVVLSNAFKTGDPQLGADMLQFMKNHDHEFDSYTYLTLLKDAVARGDRGRVDNIVQEVESQEAIRTNPFIANKIFHSHYVFIAKHMDADADRSGVFYSMLDMYNTLHDITPLKELGIIPPQYTPRVEGANTPPSPIALYLMIATYFRCRKRLVNVQWIYTRFRELVAQGHPTIAPLVETDHVYNEFLVALRGNPRGLRACVRLVEDMLQPPSPPADNPSDKAIVHVKPTVRTWSILLSAFVFNRQPLAVEKIKEMMGKHKVEFDDVTWNIIINGHANAQNIRQTAAAIKAMEEQGFAIDPYTMRSLRYLRDPERLWVALGELDESSSEAVVQPAVPTPEPESKIHSVRKQDEKLLDSGLQKLGARMKPKL